MYRPELVEETRDQASARFRFRVDPKLAYFAGHFSGWPILPGIVQIHWAIDVGRRCFATAGVCRRLEHVKFHRIVTPSIELQLTLNYDATRARLEFLYDNATAKYSSGVVFFGDAA